MESRDLEWTWRTTTGLPERCLVVVSRTVYDDKAWEMFKDALVPGYYRLLGDPNVIGIGVRTFDADKTTWGVSAWYSYDALEKCVYEQVEWLTRLVEELDTGSQLRHNSYRMFNTRDLPLSWSHAEKIIKAVMKASPLGAEAFPELSRLLGIQNGGQRA